MPNRLAGETSPYLIQHAGNPVDWHPWDDEALALARREGKPILLSIGYSACHWCHVMAHESFEDPRVAAAMNADFVNIKVDREERPDLDQIYQTAHALMTRRSGGWPLTMFLTPDGAPFFGGTYFPKEGRYGLPGFLDLLPRVAAAYRERSGDIAEQAAELKNALASLEPAPDGRRRTLRIVIRRGGASRSSCSGSTPNTAGSARRPSFRTRPISSSASLRTCGPATPTHSKWSASRSRGWPRAASTISWAVASAATASMREWTIPHFEKMLYDNGPLLGLYADLARVTGDARFADVARGIVGWMTREMRAPDGAFFSSLDADSEGEEGKFYVWDRDEVRALLPPEAYAVAAPHYGLDGPPNFEGRALEPARERAACRRRRRARDPARRRPSPGSKRRRPALFAARAGRVRPGLDDKILTSWNALAIAGLARAARALDVPQWADLACAATDALRSTAWRDGRLLATRKGERAHLNAYLDDYAFLLARVARASADPVSRRGLRAGRESSPTFCWTSSKTRSTAAFSSRATTTSGSSTGRSPATTTRRLQATASRRARSSCSAICARSRATSRRASARCGCFAPAIAQSPAGFSSLLAAEADRDQAADVGPARRRSGDVRRVAAASPRDAASGSARLRRRGRGVPGRARQRRRAGTRSGGVAVRRHALLAADCRLRRYRARARSGARGLAQRQAVRLSSPRRCTSPWRKPVCPKRGCMDPSRRRPFRYTTRNWRTSRSRPSAPGLSSRPSCT